jgi:sugar phosphate isomerase/epimerase
MQRNVTVAVASWSLRPASAADLAESVHACGLDAVQLALDPLRTGAMPMADVEQELAGRSMRVVSGMMGMEGEDYSTLESIRVSGGIVPDATWGTNRRSAADNARIARELGIGLVSFHAGFVPHEKNATRTKLMDRLRDMADIFAKENVSIALETGQENATTLAELLHELRDSEIGVNFDPANMILYGMGDPVDAVAPLAPHIRQVHIKDAVATTTPGTWGTEVPAGAGDVRWYDFFKALRENRVQCDFVIEREAGDNRRDDIRAAVALLKQENAL